MRGYDGIAILLCYSDRNGVPLLQEGDGIVIRNAERLASDVLPRYYKHSNYQSFVRQVRAPLRPLASPLPRSRLV